MLEKGVKVSAGTDATRVASYNPWVSLAWLVTGRTVGGLRIYPQRNCLDRETALRMWTENVTWFSNEEGKKGRIEVGQLADLIVPDRDYFACAESEIADTVSELTIVGGKIVYGAGDFARLDRRRRRRRCPTGRRCARFGGYAAWGDAAGPTSDAAPASCDARAAAPAPAASTATITPRLVEQAADRRPQELLGRARLRLLGRLIMNGGILEGIRLRVECGISDSIPPSRWRSQRSFTELCGSALILIGVFRWLGACGSPDPRSGPRFLQTGSGRRPPASWAEHHW